MKMRSKCTLFLKLLFAGNSMSQRSFQVIKESSMGPSSLLCGLGAGVQSLCGRREANKNFFKTSATYMWGMFTQIYLCGRILLQPWFLDVLENLIMPAASQ